MVPAKLRNTAGIVGAAWLAANRMQQPGLVREGTSEHSIVE
jgi:polyphosphate glucokinase